MGLTYLAHPLSCAHGDECSSGAKSTFGSSITSNEEYYLPVGHAGEEPALDALKASHPNRDEWLYYGLSRHDWVASGVPSGGSRSPYYAKCSTSGEQGCLRFDKKRNHCGAVAEKICCDLGTVLELPVPPALLLVPNPQGLRGVVTRRFSGVCTPLRLIKGSYVADNEGWASFLEEFYPVEMLAFDAWVGNIDRRSNLDNSLLVEEGGPAPSIKAIDFDLAFGGQFNRWSKNRDWKDFGFVKSTIPILEDVQFNDGLRKRVFSACDRIAGLTGDTVRHIVSRVGGTCSETAEVQLCQVIDAALLHRASHLGTWLKEHIA